MRCASRSRLCTRAISTSPSSRGPEAETVAATGQCVYGSRTTQAKYLHDAIGSTRGRNPAGACPGCGDAGVRAGLIDILAVTTRGDVRSDVLKELEGQLASLSAFNSRPGVDTQRLKNLTSNLTRLRGDLTSAGSAFLQPLRNSEFLSAIKQRSAIPGGTCEFDLPDYYYWLTQPDEARMRAFSQWLGLLRPMCDAVAELLWLTRQNGRNRQETAKGGTLNITFDRDNPLQLLRISLPASAGLYPEISGSHHRCNIRFLTWNGLTARPTQAETDVTFTLSCCA
ncbi:MAG: cell division protein ZapD [Gammaproteobacteria bacterium]|nr:MAG: cell division protein ZapD [Gammaproteobacteria bacterium]